MRNTQDIVVEIRVLLDQQTEAIQGKLGPIETIEYAARAKRLQDLVELLSEASFAVRER
jgi:hypothetical protein